MGFSEVLFKRLFGIVERLLDGEEFEAVAKLLPAAKALRGEEDAYQGFQAISEAAALVEDERLRAELAPIRDYLMGLAAGRGEAASPDEQPTEQESVEDTRRAIRAMGAYLRKNGQFELARKIEQVATRTSDPITLGDLLIGQNAIFIENERHRPDCDAGRVRVRGASRERRGRVHRSRRSTPAASRDGPGLSDDDEPPEVGHSARSTLLWVAV